MKKLFVYGLISLFISGIGSATVSAAKPVASKELVGYDVSYPQCGKKLPSSHSFAIVGVNGGTAAKTNPCLAEQLIWAKKATGGTGQPNVQLYVNTANPGEIIDEIDTWPSSNTDKTGFITDNPYGTCAYQNDLPCSWQYGWNRALEAHLDRFVPAAQTAAMSVDPAAYVWWLDVETMNTWQSGSSEALARNTAALEGWTAYFNAKNAKVGLYSTAVQWNEITGTPDATKNMDGLPNWRPSGASLSNAKANCTVAPLTAGGFISMTQYVQQNIDKNHSCI